MPLQQVVRLHRDEQPEVELRLEAQKDAGLVEIDVDLMGQVFKNLVLNALAVVPRPGGKVILDCTGDRDAVTYHRSGYLSCQPDKGLYGSITIKN